jgi:hypothetical protein
MAKGRMTPRKKSLEKLDSDTQHTAGAAGKKFRKNAIPPPKKVASRKTPTEYDAPQELIVGFRSAKARLRRAEIPQQP